MSNGYNQDLDAAIASLSRAVEGMEQRCAALDVERSSLNRDRKAYLTQTAASLLPEISKQVLANLRTTKPRFVTVEVEKAFKSKAKFLGLFARSGYGQTLAQLQSRLASHLDETKHGELKQIDMELADIVEQIEGLLAKNKDTLDLLKIMEQARQKKVVLPTELSEKVSNIASMASKRRPAHSVPSNRRQSSTSHTYNSSAGVVDDYTDLMIYLATDFPTSLRTLMLSSIENHQVTTETVRSNSDSFGGNGGGGYTSTDSIQSDSSYSNDSGASAAAVVSAGVGVAAVAVAGVAIATDDSLGFFS